MPALTRDGTPWVPLYIDAIDQKKCIGCGRCFKVCGHGVLGMKGITEDEELVEADDDEAERMVMTIVDGGKCVGCHACGLVCGSKAMTHVAATAG